MNGDNVDVNMFDAAFTSSGVKSYAFVPASSPSPLDIEAWPTLQEMITAGTRLVMFLGMNFLSRSMHITDRRPGSDYGANPSAYPYILDEFSYFFETPYDTTDPMFPECSLDRPPGASPSGRMYIVNHFLDLDIFGILIPDDAADEQTNAATGSGSFGSQVGLCEGLYGYNPKGVLVDYFDRGNVFVAQNTMNGL